MQLLQNGLRIRINTKYLKKYNMAILIILALVIFICGLGDFINYIKNR